MACLVLVVSFSFPFSASTRNTFFSTVSDGNYKPSNSLYSQEKNRWKLVLDRPLRQFSYITDTKLSTSGSVTESISTLNRISLCHCLATLRSQCEVSSCPKSVKSCTVMVISGYWMSPDIDDGWGFVEAFVNRVI